MFEIQNLIYILPALLISMTIHEMMHAYAADLLGDTTAREQGRISFNPIDHIDPVMTIALPLVLLLFGMPPILAAKPVPFNPARVKYDEFGAAMVGVAGPISNLLIASIAAGILKLIVLPQTITTFLVIFCSLNIALFVFNMLPIPPLDGSRLLYAFAPESLQRVMAQIEAMGFTFLLIVLFVLLPVLSPILQSANSALLTFLLG